MIDNPYVTDTPMPWLDPASPAGLCVDSYVPADSWFPEKGRGRDDQLVTEAKELCAVCPIRAACLDWAIAEDVPGGIFGGLTRVQRRQLARQAAA